MAERDLDFWDEDEWREIVGHWPAAVQRGFASRLRTVQLGEFPQSRDKPLKGFAIPLREMWHRDGQRVVYTVEYATLNNRVYVIDAFEKDSGDGKEMRTSDKSRIEARAKAYKAEMEALKLSLQKAERGRTH